MMQPVDIAALKTATRLLVQDVGDLAAAASATRVSGAHIARAYDRQFDTTLAPIDVIADLERVGGTPRVTAELARLQGHRLVSLVAAQGRMGRSVAQVLAGASDVGAAYARATEDGRVTAAERAAIITELAELAAAVEAALGVLVTADETE
ncbi:hypothetical protein GXW78_27305 [Roseomonas terrae]|uniref:Uncharacterized protein n=1 Tax=Neoroseomonas terrae TaxID=424799 RepID=A0ABS5EQR8_9PROT|nr:hypothetical protein [Neoroseomonas terrae]MBR0653388.1 hypothetical protein [Neoroseomonas terrae]